MSNRVIKVTIEISVKHIDSAPGLLHELAETMSRENDCGMLQKEDGDMIKWGSNVSHNP